MSDIWGDWIEWKGGGMPVRGDERVRVFLRGGSTGANDADFYDWSHTSDGGDIIRYRRLRENEVREAAAKSPALNTDRAQVAVWPEGRKDDGGKSPYHLLPPEFLESTTAVLAFGAAKYQERNWEKGMAWSRCFSALMRHMWAWWRGEKADPETGLSHLAHASCCIAFLLTYEQRSAGTDDRPEAVK